MQVGRASKSDSRLQKWYSAQRMPSQRCQIFWDCICWSQKSSRACRQQLGSQHVSNNHENAITSRRYNEIGCRNIERMYWGKVSQEGTRVYIHHKGNECCVHYASKVGTSPRDWELDINNWLFLGQPKQRKNEIPQSTIFSSKLTWARTEFLKGLSEAS